MDQLTLILLSLIVFSLVYNLYGSQNSLNRKMRRSIGRQYDPREEANTLRSFELGSAVIPRIVKSRLAVLQSFSRYHPYDYEYFRKMSKDDGSEPELSDAVAFYTGTSIEVYVTLNVNCVRSAFKNKFTHRNYSFSYNRKLYTNTAQAKSDAPMSESGIFIYTIPATEYDGMRDVTSKEPLLNFVFFSKELEISWDMTIPIIPKDTAPKYDFTIVSYVSSAYSGVEVARWISYHMLQGIQHFDLYFAEENPDVECSLHNLVNNGTVSIMRWKWPKLPELGIYIEFTNRVACIHSGVYRNKYRSKYMVVIDIDEYLYPKDASLTLLQNVNEFFDTSDTVAMLIPSYQLAASPPMTEPSSMQRRELVRSGDFYQKNVYRSENYESARYIVATRNLNTQLYNHFCHANIIYSESMQIFHYNFATPKQPLVEVKEVANKYSWFASLSDSILKDTCKN